MGLSKLLFGFKKAGKSSNKIFKSMDKVHSQNQKQIKKGWFSSKADEGETKRLKNELHQIDKNLKKDAVPKFSIKEEKALEKETNKMKFKTDKEADKFSLTKSSTFEEDALKKKTELYEKDFIKTKSLFDKNSEEPKEMVAKDNANAKV
jgi:hypothetical protein